MRFVSRPRGTKGQDVGSPGRMRKTSDPPCPPVSGHCSGVSSSLTKSTHPSPGNDSAHLPLRLQQGGSVLGPPSSSPVLCQVLHHPGPQSLGRPLLPGTPGSRKHLLDLARCVIDGEPRPTHFWEPMGPPGPLPQAHQVAEEEGLPSLLWSPLDKGVGASGLTPVPGA